MNQISVAMKVTPTNVSLYCTASKRTLLHWHMTITDPPGIMFVIYKKYLAAMHKYIMVIPAHSPARIVCG